MTAVVTCGEARPPRGAPHGAPSGFSYAIRVGSRHAWGRLDRDPWNKTNSVAFPTLSFVSPCTKKVSGWGLEGTHVGQHRDDQDRIQCCNDHRSTPVAAKLWQDARRERRTVVGNGRRG